VNQTERDQFEREIRAHHEAGELGRAAELLLRGYGEEIRRWILCIVHDESACNDVFGMFCEDLWRGFAAFRWESPVRIWSYRLARHAAFRLLRHRQSRRGGEIPPTLAAPAERSMTQPWLRSEVKASFARLRERLSLQEQMILVLRVDHQMSWEDIADVVGSCREPPPAAALRRQATALRQRFRRIKSRLRQMALEEGLLPINGG
jgi:RNA polymerase sigma-70 factor (ECF subfamily)